MNSSPHTCDMGMIIDNILSYSYNLGLFSEHVGLDGSQWGNFPQTYSHVGLMNTAYQITRSLNLPSYL